MQLNSNVRFKVKNNKFIIAIVVFSVLIYIFEGIAINPFALWNMLPLLLSFMIYRTAHDKETNARLYGAYGFLVGSMILSGYFHIAWFFNISEIKTGSSTSGLIFIFIPVYSMISGGVGYLIGKGVASFTKT